MAAPLPVIALVGRPNVGKSTLFNRLTASRAALVADVPGVTRDRQYGYAVYGARHYIVVDTGGIGQDDEAIEALALAQTDMALAEADAVLLVTDARQGLTAGDDTITERLRRVAAPVYVAVNKSEGQSGARATAEFHALGLGQPWAISAAHGDRIEWLLKHVFDHLGPPRAQQSAPRSGAIRLALLGRPNAGKSTLVNRLVGGARMLTQATPGTTRDAVASEFCFDEQPYVIVDTAGVRRRGRIDDNLEKLSVIKAMQAAAAAQIVICVLDGAAGLATQDIRLLDVAVTSGRAVVIALNKWDGLTQARRAALRGQLIERIGGFDYLPLCFISALHGSGLRELIDAVAAGYAAAYAELPTPALSRALEDAVAAHPPPAIHGRRIKLRFAHQGGRNPPTIVVHGNQTQRLSNEYRRYLRRFFRERFDLFGTPIALVFRNSDNPYAGKARTGRARAPPNTGNR